MKEKQIEVIAAYHTNLGFKNADFKIIDDCPFYCGDEIKVQEIVSETDEEITFRLTENQYEDWLFDVADPNDVVAEKKVDEKTGELVYGTTIVTCFKEEIEYETVEVEVEERNRVEITATSTVYADFNDEYNEYSHCLYKNESMIFPKPCDETKEYIYFELEDEDIEEMGGFEKGEEGYYPVSMICFPKKAISYRAVV